MKSSIAPVCGLAVLLLAPLAAAAADADKLSFNRDILPILSSTCFACHGPDAEQRQAGLRLDDRQSALGQADSGDHAIVPGDLAASQLVARITSDDEDLRMPPADAEKQLSADQIETLKRWIAEGAEFEGHWAFAPPRRPAMPEVGGDSWPRNPIDHFVLARLRAEGLSPNEPAARTTLIRRVSLDLTGLPPTPDEVDAFLQDTRPDAYERLVDRLLMSPHYGERMALPWLDYARFADSNGFQTDNSRSMWPWRDWVIGAYNRNLPFDQFTIEQLAGDLLENPSEDQIVATGFNRNHRLNGEGGRIVEEWFAETVIDRVETTGLTWMGLTLGCCRCHDHKYDPVTQREFYQLYAFFNSNDESGVLAADGKRGNNTPPLLTVASGFHSEELEQAKRQVSEAEQRLKMAEGELPELLAAWERKQATVEQAEATWTQLAPSEVKSVKGATFEPQGDGSFLATGKNPANDRYEITAPLPLARLTGVLLETLPHPSLPNKSIGRGSNGNFVLTHAYAEIRAPLLEQPQLVEFVASRADYEQDNWPAASVVGNHKGWAVDGHLHPVARRILFVPDAPVKLPEGAVLHFFMKHDSQFGDHNVGRIRLSASSQDADRITLSGDGLPAAVQAALDTPQAERTGEQSAALAQHFRQKVDNPARRAETELEAARAQLKKLEGRQPSTMVMKEVAPRPAHILVRGQYDKPGEPVERGVPAVLPPLPEGEPLNRLGLARWIVRRDHPLTARVWVNRAWEHFFGTGIVKTAENLGVQADYPSHPQLLDWLAVEFMAPTVLPDVAGRPPQPWDMKAMHKLIVTSAAYRQSAKLTEERLRADPDNRLISRGPRFRLTGELIRDQALAVSGLLAPKIGGPSVRPYMPPGVWDETSRYGDLRSYKHGQGDDLYRRTMYTIWKRTAAPPTMLLFDAPNREVCTILRSRTNTPLQALSLLNEITFVEAARAFGERMLREGGDTPEQRIAFGYRLALARPPSPEEMSVLFEGLEADLRHFTADPEAAGKLIGVGESAPGESLPGESALGESLPPAALAAYTLAANVILNLDEFVTRE